MADASREEKRAAKERRQALLPQLAAYDEIEHVLWPFVTITAQAKFANGVVTTDSRGHRVTRLGTETARSDDLRDGTGFVLGGSAAFGVGASDDAGALAAALWRRTQTPYVNLGIRRGSSTQELVSALPFADRSGPFVLFTGVNNLTLARGGGELDPLFGAVFGDAELRALASLPLRRVAKLARNPLGSIGDAALYAEVRRRLARRLGGRAKSRLDGEPESTQIRELAEIVELAASRHLRDLRVLRRMVPDGAAVLFALQPFAAKADREPSPEEEEIFAALDLIQGGQWKRISRYLFDAWDDYAAALRRGCADLGVPFVDLSNAQLDGWCFVDRVHMTDRGYDAAAAAVAKALAGTA